MWTRVVVDLQPIVRLFSDLIQIFKYLHIEHGFAISSVESFDEAVLHWFSLLDKFQFDTVFFCPFGNRNAGEFRSVVKSQAQQKSTPFGDLIENSDDSSRSQTQINLDLQSLSIKIIDQIECPKSSAVPKRV